MFIGAPRVIGGCREITKGLSQLQDRAEDPTGMVCDATTLPVQPRGVLIDAIRSRRRSDCGPRKVNSTSRSPLS